MLQEVYAKPANPTCSNCEICGILVDGRARFCGGTCRQRNWRRRHPTVRIADRVCSGCGTTFTRARGWFCSVQCRSITWKRLKRDHVRTFAKNLALARKREHLRIRIEPEMRKPIKSQQARDKRLRRYGLTHDLYKQLLAAQGGGCAICTSPLAMQIANGVHIDHDHVTGAVRGLLCKMCNSGLGMYRDNVELMLRAVEYLRHHAATKTA
jgi:Recombination endonuclease VII